MDVAHLVVGEEPVAKAYVATSRRERAKGLLGRRGFDGALVLPGVGSVHTVGMQFCIDVAFARWCEPRTGAAEQPRAAVILEIVPMKPNRIGRTRRCDLIIEAAAGQFRQWGIGAGTTVMVTETELRP